MLARRIVQRNRVLPHLYSKRWMSSSNTPNKLPPTEEVHAEVMTALMWGGCVGGVIGGSYGSYHGYMLHRDKSYYDCVVQTTLECFIGTSVGVWAGCLSVCVAPVVVPILCMCVPVAGGAILVKYFDKHATNTNTYKIRERR